MDNRKQSQVSPPPVGGASLLVVFAVLCLTVFALLSLSTIALLFSSSFQTLS